jgi:hypothetical protein
MNSAIEPRAWVRGFFRLAPAENARELGRQHDVLAAIPEDLAETRFRAAARIAVGVGLVEERDPEVERLVDDLSGCLEIDAATEIVAAQTDDRDAEA